MDLRTMEYLREVFAGEPPLWIDEDGQQRLWFRDLMRALKDAPEKGRSVVLTLFPDHGADTWLTWSEEDVAYLDRAIHEIFGQQN